ncbi:universal stress protein [Nocardia otitidiscaviarum]|uniref:universal stress protein n=1 Tax=Nocardia otitidiscaviarum TaxID=1823 RepID=UPI001E29DF09|nr:universal stress protein [Nocardia otitidiscaviarum]
MNREEAVPCVMVPLDGSVQARRALEPAVRVAQVLGCPVELVTVYDQVRGRWARDIEETADQLPYDQVEVAVVGSGWPGEVIADMAADQAGTLICMATQDHDELQRLVLGSVSTHLIRAVDGPILFVGPGCTGHADAAGYRRLVVCIDESARAATAVSLAAEWARLLTLEVELVHVAADESSCRAIEPALTSHVQHLTASGLTATATVLVDDNPAQAIAELLTSRPYALALTVSQGRGSLTRLLLGSVTAELLTRSDVPVLVAQAS